MSQKQAVESEDGSIRVNPGQTGATEAIERLREAMDTLARKRHSVGANERQDSAGLTRAMVARFEGAIETDSAGQSALRRLRNQRIENVARLDSRVPFKRLLPGASVMTLTLHDRLSFLFPPYDFEWHWGNAKQTVADRATGSVGALGESGHFGEGNDGPIHAASGIGVLLTTERACRVSLRPFIQYSWEYIVAASGAFSFASATGGIDASAFLNGQVVDDGGVHRSRLFSDSRGWAGKDRDTDDGIVWVPDVTVDFQMEPGGIYAVPFGAWIDCDHQSGIGVSGGAAKVQGQVKWIVVEQFPAG